MRGRGRSGYPRASLTLTAGAMVLLSVGRPCQRHQRAVLRHGSAEDGLHAHRQAHEGRAAAGRVALREALLHPKRRRWPQPGYVGLLHEPVR